MNYISEETRQLLTDIAEDQSRIKEVGYNEGFEAGKKSEYDAFWDAYQQNGNLKYYKYAFGGQGWTENTFKPKYDIDTKSSSQSMFQESKINGDLGEILQQCGVRLIFYGTIYNMTFYATRFTALPELDFTEGKRLIQTFMNSGYLVTIRKVKINELGDVTFERAFENLNALVNIVIEGVIGTNFDIHWSPLSVASLKDIITHLKDYSGTSSEYTYTVSFKATAFAELEAEGATSPHGNTWAEYIDDLKWKLTKAS